MDDEGDYDRMKCFMVLGYKKADMLALGVRSSTIKRCYTDAMGELYPEHSLSPRPWHHGRDRINCIHRKHRGYYCCELDKDKLCNGCCKEFAVAV